MGVGDCNYGCIEKPKAQFEDEKKQFEPAEKKYRDNLAAFEASALGNKQHPDYAMNKKKFEKKEKYNPPTPFELPPIPKISYPGEEQAMHACKNIQYMDKHEVKKRSGQAKLKPTWWPW